MGSYNIPVVFWDHYKIKFTSRSIPGGSQFQEFSRNIRTLQVQSREIINYWRTIKPVSVTSLDLQMAGMQSDSSGQSLSTHPNNPFKCGEQSQDVDLLKFSTVSSVLQTRACVIVCVSRNSRSHFLRLVFTARC